MRRMRVITFLLLTAMLFFAGCASMPMLVSQWTNPAYESPYFKRIAVSCVDGHISIRRNCEDEFVAQLRAAGVDALPSYRSFPEDAKLDETKMKQMAKEAGADGALIVRPVRVEEKTEVSPTYFPSPGFGIFGRHVSATWYGWYGAPRVYRYDEYTSEATLNDLRKNEVVWSGTLKTTAPDNVDSAIKTYVGNVIGALKDKNLLRMKQ
ncbi:MAG TPA: hypothetical protein VFK25_08510 [Candidatus Binatia bacterium]|nr:hypothetical protein [Candidatus Binatia bacterium]